MRRFLAMLPALLLLVATHAYAIDPGEALDDPALEGRARALSSELRCLVCQNESIEESHAELAKDLRMLVRKRVLAGDSDEQVLDYVVERYGEFVLLRPPFEPATWGLWLGPLALLIGGGLGVYVFFRSTRRVGQSPLAADEQEALNRLMAPDQDPGAK